MAGGIGPKSSKTGRDRRQGPELVVLTGTRLHPSVSARPYLCPKQTRLRHLSPGADGYNVVTVRPEKSATVSSSVQSPMFPTENRSSRSFIFTTPS
jgi:hypothetical protein